MPLKRSETTRLVSLSHSRELRTALQISDDSIQGRGVDQVISVYGLSPEKCGDNLPGQLLLLKEGLEACRGVGRVGSE